jgi:hypothetical protein
MYYRKSTLVPNKLFDIHLKALSVKELKVLLVVVRQTLGWVDSNGDRKKRDWMSQKFLANKTGLSPKSVSQGIGLLVSKRLIRATNRAGVDFGTLGKDEVKNGCILSFPIHLLLFYLRLV